MSKAISNVNVVFGATTQKLTAELRRANSRLTKFEKQSVKIAGAIGLAFGARAVVQGLKDGVMKIAEFQAEMSKVKAISGATNQEFEKLKDNALEMGRSTKFTAQQVASLQVEFSKLGFSSQEIVNSTEATLALATATGEDLATAATVAGSTLRAFQLDAREMGRVTDVMGSSFTSSALDLSKFAESMKYAAPVAKSAGISIEFTTAMLSALADAGISGSMAGTSLRRIMNEMAKTGKPTAEAFAEVASKGITLEGAMDEVGRTAQTALTVLGANVTKVNELAGAYENAEGAAANMAAIVEDNLLGDLTKLESAWDGQIQKGGWVADIFREIAQAGTVMLGGGDDAVTEMLKRIKGESDIANLKGIRGEFDALLAVAGRAGDLELVSRLNSSLNEIEGRLKTLKQGFTGAEMPKTEEPKWIADQLKEQTAAQLAQNEVEQKGAEERAKNYAKWKEGQDEIAERMDAIQELEELQAEGRKSAADEIIKLNEELIQSYDDLFGKMRESPISEPDFLPDDDDNTKGEEMAEMLRKQHEEEDRLNAQRVESATRAGQQIANVMTMEATERKKAIGEMLKANAAMIISDLIKSAVASFPPPFNIIAAGVAAAAGGALLNKIPALAEGGIVTGPTLAMIGEGKHPEAVVPLPNGIGGLGGGAEVNINLEGFVKGSDLHFLVNKHEGRIAGT